jgi:hypothetical protein
MNQPSLPTACLAALWLAGALSGCDGPLDHRVKAAVTQKEVPQGIEMRCRESVSNQCHIVVYTEECTLPQQDANTRVVSCTAKVHRRLSVPAGEAVTVPGLPQGHLVCVKSQPEPEFPSCIFAPPWVRQMQDGAPRHTELVVGE